MVLKDLAKTTSSMPVVNKVLGIETVPASALPNAAIAATGICASALYGVHKSLWEHKDITRPVGSV